MDNHQEIRPDIIKNDSLYSFCFFMGAFERDEVIYRRFLTDRDERDLRTLLERHGESLTLFAYGYVHSMEDAEEIMMDAFATVAAGRSRFAGRSSFKTWLFSIGHNLALMHLRKKKINTVSIEEIGDPRELRPELSGIDIIEEDRRRRLYQALEEINPEYKQVLYLIYFEEMTPEEIGKVMSKNRKQIYNLADRGRRALKEKLTDIDIG